MDFARHCAEITHQTELLVADVAGADLGAPVPSCPGWTLGMLLRHIGGGHRWATDMVRLRADDWLPDDVIRKVEGDDTGAPPADWLLEGAHLLTATLEAAGPDLELFAPFDYDRATFWARRFANETVVHRADACLAAPTPFVVATDVAIESIDEWLELDAKPEHFDITPQKRDLLGPGRTVCLVAPEAAWTEDFTGDVITWRRGEADAAVTARGSVTDLLLLVYGRTGPDALDVTGDRAVLDRWLRLSTFG
jgi:uncharacterized protein (TIGR03083 family)